MSNSEITLQSGRSVRAQITRRRITLISGTLIAVFAAIALRLVQLGSASEDLTSIEGVSVSEIEASRPAILDRNGLELAVDIRVPSLYAEPRSIIDVDEAASQLRTVLPELEPVWLKGRLTGDRGFVWIKRELTPDIQDRIMALGLPGIGFLTESRRFYPGGNQASHVLGAVNIDNQGIAGMEQRIDLDGLAALQEFGIARDQPLAPARLSLDLRVQHAMVAELTDAIGRYRSIAAAGALMDVRTGEILGLVSLPDFDPNEPASALGEGRFNRITAGNFELGSVVKTVAFAAALDAGAVKLTDRFDARFPLRFGRQSISDFRGESRILTVPEIFRYSSNVGTAQMVQQLGPDNYRSFFERLGFDRSLQTELPEMTQPNVPGKFTDIVAATASFGHGFSISPLHMLRAVAAFVNGGRLVQPTLYPATESAWEAAPQVLEPETSARMRFLLRMNALIGSGSRMNRLSEGYRVGGKTGTAEKVIDGRYAKGKNLNVFVTAFPMDAPRYAMIILVDEAEAENEQSGNTAGWNAGEVSGRIIARVAPMLGIAPVSELAEADNAMVPPELLASGWSLP